MKLNLTAIALTVAIVGTALPVMAGDQLAQTSKQTIGLKDGSTLYVFKDGKMSMEDKNGRAVRMKAGHVMETKDGQRLVMVGNEVARLETLQKQGHLN